MIDALRASLSARRAWIEMPFGWWDMDGVTASLSARRAWIEILRALVAFVLAVVALRKESVDRNAKHHQRRLQYCLSLSARRAWIEIIECSYHNIKLESLSARRAWIEIG